MNKKIQLRELLAWTVFLLAFILFSATLAFASESSRDKVDGKDKQTHIMMIKSVNGKTVKIDTTFTAKSDEDSKRIVEEINNRFEDVDSDADFTLITKGKNTKEKNKQLSIQLDLPHLSETERKKIREEVEQSMKEMEKSFEEVARYMQDIKFNFDFANDSDDVHMQFNMPSIPALPLDSTDLISVLPHNELPDSLKGDEHIVIRGKAGEEPPVFEKLIQEKSGETYFIYKRKNDVKSNSEEKSELNVFPNPASGKFTVSFNSKDLCDAVISVFNSNGKEVYRLLSSDVKGNHSIEIDLGSKAKGRYIVSVQLGNICLTRKLTIIP